jgi:hypothetical protein
MWMTMSNKSYDFAYTRDHYGKAGRFHHVTYALDSREEILRAADIFLENGVHIETGPHKHAIQQTFFLYVYEPGGNRVEVANAGARLILAPDWKPIVWTEEQLCFRRPVYGRPQGWRCAPPPPAADGLDPVRPPVFRLGMRSAGAERDRSLCDG